MMKVDAVFAGGGVKAFTFIGAMKALEENNYSIERVAGTSAGAITAALIKAGYTAEELTSILLPVESKDILDETLVTEYLPWLAWLLVYRKLGLYKGEKLENWIQELLRRKGVHSFRDLPEGSLKIIASDVTAGRMIVFPDDIPSYGKNISTFPLSRAIRMSCSLPYFFQPVKWKMTKKKNHLILDGGLLSNFPMWIFQDDIEGKLQRPVIGFQLSPAMEEGEVKKIKNAVILYQSLFDTMRKAHDLRYISKNDAKNIVFLTVDDVKTTQFTLSLEQKQQLIDMGQQQTLSYLKTWTG
ncbi:patatin-like phospholipase family protein [Alteribacillus sp. HJP-4]|uniref:patatin-like phospholipase family protein n=1 Tax=Alteribacillus sp. HJP-4 TaxID=2775394 RepID=UPI0035CCEC80